MYDVSIYIHRLVSHMIPRFLYIGTFGFLEKKVHMIYMIRAE